MDMNLLIYRLVDDWINFPEHEVIVGIILPKIIRR